VERQILKLRSKHPTWGGRKLRCRLQSLGHADVPAASTITEILRRHGQLDPQRADQPRDWQRFEHASPNDLWQMDFKGHFALIRDGRCHPLTVLDDHSRYSLSLRACGDECGTTVQAELTRVFRHYGLPRRMTMDNGPPWGFEDGETWTRLTAWLIRLGVRVTHGRPYHPQTQGKDERFHRTLKLELLSQRSFSSLGDCQQAFDPWRLMYNTERPHEALGMATPASRYRPSGRSFPEVLPPIEYASDVQVRKVSEGRISFRNRDIRVGKAFNGHPVGVRGIDEGIYEVLYSISHHHNCYPCPRTPVTHVSGTNRGERVPEGRVRG
jgi:transposase InsO family protein